MEKLRIRKWFETRQQEIRPYQIDAIHDTFRSLEVNEDPTVLAACPSAGKTMMSIAFLDLWLKANPNKKVLVLTHGQTILRSQYTKDLERLQNIRPDLIFTFDEIKVGTEILTSKSQVVIAIPQTIIGQLEHEDFPDFDFLVVDEAHHRFLGKDDDNDDEMEVQRIKNKIKPEKILLLTGTPFKFKKRGFPIIPVTVQELYPKYIPKFYIDLATSSYQLDNKDFNNKYELTAVASSKVETKRVVNDTLDSLLNQLVERVSSDYKDIKRFRSWRKIIDWDRILRKMDKTMFICSGIKQAVYVHEYFLSKGIDVRMSISENKEKTVDGYRKRLRRSEYDLTDQSLLFDDGEIEDFRDKKRCKVLILVDKGILGFNMPNLLNIVDMSNSENPTRLFQLLGRILRKSDNNEDKLYIKIFSSGREHYLRNLMNFVSLLTHKAFYTTYTEDNFRTIRIPDFDRVGDEITERRDRDYEEKIEALKEKLNTITSAGENKKLKDEISELKKELKEKKEKKDDVMKYIESIILFEEVTHKDNQTMSIHYTTNMDEMRRRFLHVKDYVTKEEVANSLKPYLDEEAIKRIMNEEAIKRITSIL